MGAPVDNRIHSILGILDTKRPGRASERAHRSTHDNASQWRYGSVARIAEPNTLPNVLKGVISCHAMSVAVGAVEQTLLKRYPLLLHALGIVLAIHFFLSRPGSSRAT